MLTYKQIITNMVNRYVDRYVYKKSNKFPHVEKVDLEKLDSELIHFSAVVKVDYKTYEIGGCIDKDGEIFVGSVAYSGIRCTEKDANGEWIMESAKPYHEYLYGDKLDAFSFDS